MARLTDEHRGEIDRLAQDKSLSHRQIAHAVGTTEWTVQRHRKGLVARTDRLKSQRLKRQAEAVDLYRAGRGITDIAAQLRLDERTVRRYLGEAGCRLRPCSNASAHSEAANAGYLARLEQVAALRRSGLAPDVIAAQLGVKPSTVERYLRMATAPVATPVETGDWRALPRRGLPPHHPAFWPAMPPSDPRHCYRDIAMPASVARRDAAPLNWKAIRVDRHSPAGSPAALCLEARP